MVLALSVIGACACVSRPEAEAAGPVGPAEVRHVLEVALLDAAGGPGAWVVPECNAPYLERRVLWEPFPEDGRNPMDPVGVPPQLADRFLEVNAGLARLRLPGESALIRGVDCDAPLRALIDRESDREFHARYPSSRGIAAFSVPAFSDDGTQALLYVEVDSLLGEGGRGWFYWLKKSGGRWVVFRRTHAWVA